MTYKYLFHAGEATVFAREGQFTDAMPEVLIGRTDGPVGQAFANMMAQSKGHTAMFAIRACNQLVRPATIVVPKVTLKDFANIDLFGGVVQGATADAVLDCLIDGTIPKDMANALCIISLVWIDPRCATDPEPRQEGHVPHQLRGHQARHHARAEQRTVGGRTDREPPQDQARHGRLELTRDGRCRP